MKKKLAIQYALIVFIITVIWTMIEHVLGYNTTNHAVGKYTRLLTAFVYFFMVGRAIWVVKKRQQNTLTFADGFKTGSLLSVIYSALVTIWFLFYGEVINLQYQSSLIDYEKKRLIASKVSPEEIILRLKEVEKSSGGSVQSYLLLFVFMMLFGIVIAIIVSTILSRKKKEKTPANL
jgi:hypothetical protein